MPRLDALNLLSRLHRPLVSYRRPKKSLSVPIQTFIPSTFLVIIIFFSSTVQKYLLHRNLVWIVVLNNTLDMYLQI